MKFRDLQIGDTFDFMSPQPRLNSFTHRCTKISARKYRDHSALQSIHQIGTLDCIVYNSACNECGRPKYGTTCSHGKSLAEDTDPASIEDGEAERQIADSYEQTL